MRWSVFLPIIGILLAGCADEAKPADDPVDDFGQDLDDELQATDDTGIIRGVVVDVTITPVAGANITILGQGHTTISNGNGQFGFADLAPGTYSLVATRFGFESVQTTVQVVAGVDDPDVVRLLLSPIEGFNPYSKLITHEGFYQCGTNFLVVCGAPAAILPLFGQEDPTGLDSSTETFYFDESPFFIQTEMVWESTQALSPDLYFEMEALDEGCTQYGAEEALAGASAIGSASGPSPIRVRADNASLEKQQIGGESCGIYHSVFASGAQGTPVGFSLQQRFTWFITEFHGFAPAEDWWHVQDGEHPIPS